MQEELKVAIIQSNLVWENPIQNRINLAKTIESISENVDLILLPEMFTTAFTMNATSVAETMQGNTIKWMQEFSSKKQLAIAGSIIIKEDNKYYNRLLFMHPNGDKL